MQNIKCILITGGSGFVGSKLTEYFLSLGHQVIVFDFVPPKTTHANLEFLKIDLSKEKIPSTYDGKIDAIVHLAGKNIFGRWTMEFKKGVYDSRIQSTKNIVDSIASWSKKPQVLVSASAFGFYGNKGEELVHEDSPAGNDFLAHVCVDWEAEARRAEASGVRTVQVRTALVLGNQGLLAPLFVPFSFGLGAWIGTGRAWFPWVHIDDIVSIYAFSVLNENVRGPINTGAPENIRQKDFMRIFGQAMNRKVLFSIPIFLLKIKYGALAETFENSTKMSADKIQALGFQFKHASVAQALSDVLLKK